ncbi:hypothetical protein PROFUN_11872 [Planoprotostelium fungivorum]|uniref:sn-1-specific diacylglycerol lipase n=1 Tax=Planoprotostelium fungivorum TaxID=1890364 RepID=A0A2P6N9E6_9EUKA|nr:hypothetical protein PROFUN_11872 [Planoprotostelium fungivorum]
MVSITDANERDTTMESEVPNEMEEEKVPETISKAAEEVKEHINDGDNANAASANWNIIDPLWISSASLVTKGGINLASYGTEKGFQIARASTSLGFDIAKTITAGLFGFGASLLGAEEDVLGPVVGKGLDLIKNVAVSGIDLGEAITNASLHVASESVNGMDQLFGNDEATRALRIFSELVTHEWNNPKFPETFGGKTDITAMQMTTALITWILLQNITFDAYRERVLRELDEISLESFRSDEGTKHLRHFMKRYSKMALSSYGGLGLLFFSVKIPVPGTKMENTEEEDMRKIVQDADKEIEEEIRGDLEENSEEISEKPIEVESVTTDEPSFWSKLMGGHDHTFMERLSGLDSGSASQAFGGATVKGPDGQGRYIPRFFVVTDHQSREVVLVLRGTLSISDVAIDLTCREAFIDIPATSNYNEPTQYKVHGGMLEVARSMGGKSGFVTNAVAQAMRRNPLYDVSIVGHSLGAGLASVLTFMWADLESGLTRRDCGLPHSRKLRAWAFAPPCIAEGELCRRASKVLTSIVFSWDAVSRLSLGSITDLRSLGARITHGGEELSDLGKRVLSYQSGRHNGDPQKKKEEYDWLLGARSTLESNLEGCSLYPAGRTYWVLRREDLQPERESVALFQVKGKIERVFDEMVFSSNMISSHMPGKECRDVLENGHAILGIRVFLADDEKKTEELGILECSVSISAVRGLAGREMMEIVSSHTIRRESMVADIDLEEPLLSREKASEMEGGVVYDGELDEMLEALYRQAILANGDVEEAHTVIEELKEEAATLRKSNEHRETKKQMKAKREAIKLHLRYLESTLSTYHVFNHRIIARSALQSSDVKQIAAALLHVFDISHQRIRFILNLPLTSSKSYTKSIGLRTGKTNRFLQSHPSVAASIPIGLGILSIVGLSLIVGPFSLLALAVVVPATEGAVEEQSHADTKVLRVLKRASKRMRCKDIESDGVERALQYAARANEKKILPGGYVKFCPTVYIMLCTNTPVLKKTTIVSHFVMHRELMQRTQNSACGATHVPNSLVPRTLRIKENNFKPPEAAK